VAAESKLIMIVNRPSLRLDSWFPSLATFQVFRVENFWR